MMPTPSVASSLARLHVTASTETSARSSIVIRRTRSAQQTQCPLPKAPFVVSRRRVMARRLRAGAIRSDILHAFSVTSIQGECVPAGWRPRPVDGEWGHWNHWSECTKTCGIGVAFQSRQCDAPRPVHGGKYCLGVRRRYRTCNTEVSDVLP